MARADGRQEESQNTVSRLKGFLRRESLLACAFLRRESLLAISCLLTIVSCFFVPPSAAYLGYIDVEVLVLLFCLMAVVAAIRSVGALDVLSRALVVRVGDARRLALVLVVTTFLLSMFLTNDVTLITIVPLTLAILAPDHPRAAMVVVLETIAANLGSMLTPIGNPQNLYLYTHCGIGMGELMGIMLPYSAVSLVLLIVVCCFLPKDKIQTDPQTPGLRTGSKMRLEVYLALFVLCLLTVARVIDYRILLAVVVVAILIVDRSLIRKVDYSLLATFLFLFIFVGNLGQVDMLRDWLLSVIDGHEVATAVVASQLISNVPASILLSGFTGDYADLLIGCDIGGLGTLIASMASLISYRFYTHAQVELTGTRLTGARLASDARPTGEGEELPTREGDAHLRDARPAGAYLAKFTVANVAFLAVLLALNLVL